MRLRLIATMVLTLLALSAPALAGGWATTVLDEEMPALTAGDEHEIGFTILQHGVTPAAVDGAAIELVSTTTRAAHRFDAEPTGDVGHYTATVIVPEAGVWHVEVDQGVLAGGLEFAPFALDKVTVTAAGTAMPFIPGAIAGAIAIALATALVVALMRRRRDVAARPAAAQVTLR